MSSLITTHTEHSSLTEIESMHGPCAVLMRTPSYVGLLSLPVPLEAYRQHRGASRCI
jgi:hypothetical protein